MNSITSSTSCIELRKYVDKLVEITTVDGRKYLGVVYTIDPVSLSVILVKEEEREDKLGLIFIPNHGITSVEIIGNSTIPNLNDLFVTNNSHVSEEEANSKRVKLKNWFIKNRVPIEEEGEILKLGDVLEIHPPYGPDQCLSRNDIVLMKIQTLISSMPDDV